MKHIGLIGSGFASLSAACFLAKAGFNVTVFEKNASPGGRAQKLEINEFTFDMGPSWYWMPDVFERFFASFEKSVSDYYTLTRLDPSYGVKFRESFHDIPASLAHLEEEFESIEAGSAKKLRQFLRQAEFKYKVGIRDLAHKPGKSLHEFLDFRLLTGILKMDVFTSMRKHVNKYFKDPRLRQLVKFPILFLGGTPNNTPALYSLMNYADMSLGTWYPQGGMYRVVEAMVRLARELGVKIRLNEEVTGFEYRHGKITHINTSGGQFEIDVLVAGADYHFVDQVLLDEEYRHYTPRYWKKQTMAPSSLLFYIGTKTRVPKLNHHTLFFDRDFDQHASEIYETPQWPSAPLLYVSATSKTDPSIAPEGKENLVILMPVAPDLPDPEETRMIYFNSIMDRLEKFTGTDIRNNIEVMRSYAHSNFKSDYHSYRGNAYGLANTLRQTAILKPSIKNKKLKNLYYTGQLTVPGPGVPPSLISGEVVAREVSGDYA